MKTIPPAETFIINKLNEALKKNMKQLFENVNRVEVIQHSPPYSGRAYANHDAKDVEIQLQDKGKTLKVFLK